MFDRGLRCEYFIAIFPLVFSLISIECLSSYGRKELETSGDLTADHSSDVNSTYRPIKGQPISSGAQAFQILAART